GGVLCVLSTARSVREDLPSWCRFERHEYIRCEREADGARDRHLMARGPFGVPRSVRETGVALAANNEAITAAAMLAAVPFPERADPATGFAPRDARVEPGGPVYPFSLLERDRVAPPEIAQLYDQAASSQWDGTRDIAWSTLGSVRHSPALESAVAQI